MKNLQSLAWLSGIALSFASGAGAATMSVTTTTSGSMSLTGTSAEFLYTTGGSAASKFLLTQGFVGYPPSTTTASYTSSSYTQTISTSALAGSTVTAATLDFSSAVLAAMSLSAPAFESAKSLSADSGCSGGIGFSPAFTGNCRVDRFFTGSSSGPALLLSITIGSASHSFGSGADVSTLGQVDLATLSSPTSTFLSQLGMGQPITLTWSQAVSLTGALSSATAPAVLGDNMLCRECTVYYAVTSSAAQSRSLTSVFSADALYAAPILNPEPSTYVLMGAGLAALAVLRRKTSR